MKIKLILLVLLTDLIFIGSCSDKLTNPSGTEPFDDDEIYQLILENKFTEPDYQLVLIDSTHGENFAPESITWLNENFPELQVETFSNYQFLNQEHIKLKTIPGIPSLILASEFSGQKVNLKYVYFSRIGYDTNHSQALLSSGIMYSDIETGGGFLHFLQKKKGVWQLRNSIQTWIP